MRTKKPKATDWKNRPIEDWNATTFKQYLVDQHQEKFGLPYMVNNWKVHQKMIKDTYEKYGKDVTKEFIDLCFSKLKPRPPYFCLNFSYLYSYFRERFLNQAVINIQRKKYTENHNQTNQDENDKVWF